MSGDGRLPQPPADLRLPRTDRRLAGVLPDVARAFGVTDVPDVGAGLALDGVERVCVLLVDGLGDAALRARTGHAPTLRRLVADSEPVDAGYPTTTAASLASFGTGLGPGRTGMLGYAVRDPRTSLDAPGLVNLVSWTAQRVVGGGPGPGPAAEPPDPRAWQPHPTVFERLVAAGHEVTSIGPTRFAGSGLTTAGLRGATYRGAESLDARVDATLAALRRPGVAYLYWGELDKVGHHEGWSSPAWAEELGELDHALTRLLRRLPRGTAVVVTADHGMVDVTGRTDVAAVPALARDVALVAGEPRACHVHLEAGADGDAAAARWRDVLGEDAWVLQRGEALGLGLFGDVEDARLPMIGDLVVAARGTHAVVDSRTQSAASIALVGMHGSLTPAELEVPAILAIA
ncbi:alkaline phosphatase family protein [Litorihabitans aurantiacus]|uniref:Nucleotide pyrophosphatase n=1 Tax=Litorihabitans aurantiacus TaxID=1930061 RepID=A0AA37XDZ9_9MICO|nr:alkaline phosphatase family protein [Litorihabitans aurantiacus]GMA31455.1 nucleotide pyrophosphatase [Litorihabitans aurantiacus]